MTGRAIAPELEGSFQQWQTRRQWLRMVGLVELGALDCSGNQGLLGVGGISK
jgi:hypothetical protein